MATELLKAAQLLATTDLLAPEAELVEEAQPVVRREQLRTYAQRSIRVVLGGGGQSGKQNAAVLLRGVSGDAVYRTTQFFRRFGDVESAQQRPRSPSSRDCDVVIMFATGAPAERFIQYAAKEGMPLEIQRNGAVPGARGHGCVSAGFSCLVTTTENTVFRFVGFCLLLTHSAVWFSPQVVQAHP